jgi:RNA polymerase subunit RPABC4/transcription elongation factor Spt4
MFDDAGTWATYLWISGFVVFAYAAILWLASIAWVAADIQRRTDSVAVQIVAVAVTALFFLPGLILYIAIRPNETIEERTERRMEMQALAAQAVATTSCANCNRTLQEDFMRCPYCAWQLGNACPGCDRMNKDSWVVCPYCGGGQPAEVAAVADRIPSGSRRSPASVATITSASHRNGHAPAS